MRPRLTLRALVALWLALLPVAAATFPALATPPQTAETRESPVRTAYLRHWVEARNRAARAETAGETEEQNAVHDDR